MLEDGLEMRTIAKYLGVCISSVRAIKDPSGYARLQKKSYLKNREKRLKQMRTYGINHRKNRTTP